MLQQIMALVGATLEDKVEIVGACGILYVVATHYRKTPEGRVRASVTFQRFAYDENLNLKPFDVSTLDVATRRDWTQKLIAAGQTRAAVARILGTSQATIANDLRKQKP